MGARQRVDLTLQIGAVTETVQVTDAAVALERDSSDRGQVIHREAVVELPLNGRSNATLALLAPGVRQAYGLSKRESSFNVSGLRSQFNNFILDGVDNNAYGTSNQGLSNQVIQAAPDAVQEFKVTTNSYSAEYGRVGGAVINASIRSGTNELHGAVWEFLAIPTSIRSGSSSQPGGKSRCTSKTSSGPPPAGQLNATSCLSSATTRAFGGSPERSFRRGSLPAYAGGRSRAIFGIAVKNPYDGSTFPNNTIPPSLSRNSARPSVPRSPAPNLPGNTKNFSALLPSTDTDNKGDIRSDYYVSSKVTAFTRFSGRLYYQLAAPNNGIPGPSGQGAGIVSRVMNWQTASGITWTVTPTSLLEVRVGGSKTEGMKTPATLDGGPSMLDLYGITGLPTTKELTGGLNTQNVSGYQSYGRDWSSPQWQNPLV